jgi:hypothetical protein
MSIDGELAYFEVGVPEPGLSGQNAVIISPTITGTDSMKTVARVVGTPSSVWSEGRAYIYKRSRFCLAIDSIRVEGGSKLIRGISWKLLEDPNAVDAMTREACLATKGDHRK